jgi:hypothetical protein
MLRSISRATTPNAGSNLHAEVARQAGALVIVLRDRGSTRPKPIDECRWQDEARRNRFLPAALQQPISKERIDRSRTSGTACPGGQETRRNSHSSPGLRIHSANQPGGHPTADRRP